MEARRRSSAALRVFFSTATSLVFGSVALLLECRDQPTINKALPPSMPVFDSHAYARMLQLCTKNNDPIRARITYSDILKRGNCLDLVFRNILLNAYLKMRFLCDGLKVFDEMPDRNVVSLFTMIQGYSQYEVYDKAVNLFFRSHKEAHELNSFFFTTILKLLEAWIGCSWYCACTLQFITSVMVLIPSLGTSLIDAYSVFGVVGAADEVFKEVVEKDMFTGNVLDVQPARSTSTGRLSISTRIMTSIPPSRSSVKTPVPVLPIDPPSSWQ